ncbi:dNMP kinase [Pectobacterium bacteriophage PM2]|uniref:DNMP kinase n=1 Tax=Pectobacterium bacteriophage PM2 TaxID=1429794 RepID=A0A0A0Q3I9_9CAUD|nr:dNMP kinase [Pectobacterium bacteriophage PM2]AHY25127.1 dNMP kinase [Pectobacterium bacteriophage PM2]
MKLIVLTGKKRSGKNTCADFIKDNYDSYTYSLASPIKSLLLSSYETFAHNSKNAPKLNKHDFEGEGIDREKALPLNNEDAYKIFSKAVEYAYLRYNFGPGPVGINAPERIGYQEVIDSIVLNNTESWTIRRFMQTLGTDIVVDNIDRMFWMKIFTTKYLETLGLKYESDIGTYEYFVISDVRQVHEMDVLRAMGATIIHVVRPDTEIEKDDHITEKGLPYEDSDSLIVNDGTVEELYEKLKKVIKQ